MAVRSLTTEHGKRRRLNRRRPQSRPTLIRAKRVTESRNRAIHQHIQRVDPVTPKLLRLSQSNAADSHASKFKHLVCKPKARRVGGVTRIAIAGHEESRH